MVYISTHFDKITVLFVNFSLEKLISIINYHIFFPNIFISKNIAFANRTFLFITLLFVVFIAILFLLFKKKSNRKKKQKLSNQILMQKSYENLVETAHDIIIEFDRFGKYVFINKNTETITGYTIAELKNSRFIKLINKNYRKKVLHFYKQEIDALNCYPTIEFPIQTKNGNTLWVSQKVSVIKDQNGLIVGYFSISRDITFLKNDEKQKTDQQLKNKKQM